MARRISQEKWYNIILNWNELVQVGLVKEVMDGVYKRVSWVGSTPTTFSMKKIRNIIETIVLIIGLFFWIGILVLFI